MQYCEMNETLSESKETVARYKQEEAQYFLVIEKLHCLCKDSESFRKYDIISDNCFIFDYGINNRWWCFVCNKHLGKHGFIYHVARNFFYILSGEFISMQCDTWYNPLCNCIIVFTYGSIHVGLHSKVINHYFCVINWYFAKHYIFFFSQPNVEERIVIIVFHLQYRNFILCTTQTSFFLFRLLNP